MRLLLDAQLPRWLAQKLSAAGHDALHVSALPRGDRTPDAAIATAAALENRIVVTKDADFVASFWLHRSPPRLLLISTGNISNSELWELVSAILATLDSAFARHDFLELNRTAIAILA